MCGCLLLLLCVLQTPQGMDPPSASHPVNIIQSPHTPRMLESARLFVRDDGSSVLEVRLMNPAADDLMRAEVTAITHSADGKRRGVQVSELPDEVLPIEAGGRRTVRIVLTTVPVFPSDYVAAAITRAATAIDTWTYAAFSKDVDAAFVVPDIIAVNPKEAPVAIANVELTSSSTGAPLVVSYVLRNDGAQSVTRVLVHVFLFDGARTLRMERITRLNLPIQARSTLPQMLSVQDVEAKADWKVVVALGRAATEAGEWSNPAVKEQARASLIPRPRWPQ